MFRKTFKLLKRRVVEDSFTNACHMEIILREVYWFTIIPVYIKDSLYQTNM